MKTNRLISLLLCLCMVFALFTGFAESASAADDYVAYTIKNGDNLYTLVGKMGMNYGTVKYVIMALNGFTNEAQLSQLQPGQTILLPTSNQAAASLASKALGSSAATATTAVITTTTGTTTAATTTTATSSASTYNGYTPVYYMVQHTVARGENLTSICKALGTNYYDYSSIIMKINNMTSANSLKVGQTVWVPAKTGTAGGTIAVIAYSVKKDDTISGICAQYNTSYANYKDVVKAVNPKIANVEKLNVGQTVYIPVYTSYNNAVAGNPSTAAGTSGSPTTNIATGFAINFTSPSNAAYGTPFAIVGGQANATRAVAGQTVVIRPNAYNGYAVKSIKVVRTDSNAHIQTNDFAFTMPNSNVQVTIEYSHGLAINKKPSSNGSFDTLVYGELSTNAFYGDKVEIVPYPNDGYEVNTVAVTLTGTTTAVPATQDPITGLWTFNMPNAAVDVRVTFRTTNTINLRYNFGLGNLLGSGIVQFYVNGVQVTEAKKGDTVRMVIIPMDGWVIDPDTSATGTMGVLAGGNPTENPNFNTVNTTGPISLPRSFIAQTLRSGATVDDITKITEYIYDFKIPATGVAGPVDIYVAFKQRTPYALLKENLSGQAQLGTVTFTVTDATTGEIRKNAEWAYPGDTVTIVPYEVQTDYTMKYQYDPNGTVSGLGAGFGTDAYTTLVPSGSILPAAAWTGGAGIEFTMPASHVNVDPRFYAQTMAANLLMPVQIMDNQHGTIEVYSGAYSGTYPHTTGQKVNQVEYGRTYTIKVTADKNYRLQRKALDGTTTVYGLFITDGSYATTNPLPGLIPYGVVYAAQPYSATYGASTYGSTLRYRGEVQDASKNGIVETFFEVTLANPVAGLAITAYYESYNSAYNGGAIDETMVTLRTRNDNVTLPATYGPGTALPISLDLAGALTGVSGSSNVQMYVNGALAPDGTQVPVGTTVGFTFTVNDGKTLDKVEKLSNTGYNQVLSPVDGIYWYTVTQNDANITNPTITFVVTTEDNYKPSYSILYSLVGNTGDPTYTITNLGGGSAGFAAQTINPGDAGEYNTALTPATPVEPGDRIQINITKNTNPNRVLSQVQVGDTNLTMGDLTDNVTDWQYTFTMPEGRNVKIQVVYKDMELLDP